MRLPTGAQQQATITYSNEDDGLWLEYGRQRISLGHEPTVEQVMAAAARLHVVGPQA